jgi:hypothetical protein
MSEDQETADAAAAAAPAESTTNDPFAFNKSAFMNDPSYGHRYMALLRDSHQQNVDLEAKTIEEKQKLHEQFNSRINELHQKYQEFHGDGAEKKTEYGSAMKATTRAHNWCTCKNHYTASLTGEEEAMLQIQKLNLAHDNERENIQKQYDAALKL